MKFALLVLFAIIHGTILGYIALHFQWPLFSFESVLLLVFVGFPLTSISMQLLEKMGKKP